MSLETLLLKAYTLALFYIPPLIAYMVAPRLGLDPERFAMLVLLACTLGLALNAAMGSLMFPPAPQLLQP